MDWVSGIEQEPDEVTEGVYLFDLAGGERTSMMYWRIEPGATLPSHRHYNEQIGYVIDGRLTAIVENDEHVLEPGDSYMFSSGEFHGAENRGDVSTVGVGVLSPPRDEPNWMENVHGSDD